MNNKEIGDWQHILLDTSFIIDYVSDINRYNGNPSKQENIELAQKIMSALSNERRAHKPQFYVSSVTIGELAKLETKTVCDKIIECFSCGDVTFVGYGKREAMLLNETVLKYWQEKEPRASIKSLEKGGFHNVRKWISDDFKILSCAKQLQDNNRLDVVLTSDKKTFLPLATFMKLPCSITNKDYFPSDLFGDLVVKNA